MRTFGIAPVGVGRTSDGWLLTSRFFRSYGHASQLSLGRLLVTLSEALVPLSLGIINHPVASLARIGDGPWNLAERLVQRQIVADGTLKRVHSVNNSDRKLMNKRETDLPCGVGAILEPVKSGLKGLIDFLQGELLPGTAVDCKFDKGRIWVVWFFTGGRIIENVEVDRLVSIREAKQLSKVIAGIRNLMERGLVVGHPWDLTGGRGMLVHDGLHRVPRGLVADTTCGEGRRIFAHGWRRLVVRGRIISARVLFVRRCGPSTVGCCMWSVMGPATRDVFYRVSSCVLQSDALVIAVVSRVMDWRRRDLLCSLIGRKLIVVRPRVDGVTFHAGLRT